MLETGKEKKPADVEVLLERFTARHPGLEIRTTDLALFQTDIYYAANHPPLAVVAPRSASEIAELVKSARELGLTLTSRGAGLSYSAGYIPSDNRTVIIDLSAMNRILELSTVDRFVTVEPGVTWLQLHDALKRHALTTPFWGTFSGRFATVGATVSQGGKYYGSASRGSSAESVLGLEVVTGAGETIVTGSAASTRSPSPFFRNYGPDLTGLFLGDCGAFGLKTRITLQLVPAPASLGYCSFSFDDPEAQLEAMGRIGAELLASECLGMDPFTARSRMVADDIVRDLATLLEVIKGSRSLFAGLRDAAYIALNGRRFVNNVGYLMNCITEGRDAREAQVKLRRVRQIAREAGGRALPASIPKVMRAIPFPQMNGLLTPSGKRMNWLHTVVPNSRGGECFRITEAAFARHEEAMKAHGIDRGYLLSTHGPSGVGIETLIRWSDEPYPVHTHFLTDEEKSKLRLRKANPLAAAAVAALSKDIVGSWSDLGGVHLQIGRKYPYLETRLPNTSALLRDLKDRFDPDCILNPENLFVSLM